MSAVVFLSLVGTAEAQQVEGLDGPPMGWLDQPAWTFEDPDPAAHGVVGGKQVSGGKWDDAAGIVFAGAFVGCTGTLVGPKVVITAGHCVDGYPITHVIMGSKDYFDDDGEVIEVDEVFEYPGSQNTYDIAVLTLRTRADAEPRAIAIDCILKDYLEDGAKAQIVGFGATTEAGNDFNSELNEAATTILDKNCDEDVINDVFAGCQPSVSPGGEIAAGGNGTDACFGDSGGPLYLKTDEGNFLVGVTSRAFLGVNFQYPCRDGGIWVRPDAVIDWLEEKVDGKPMVYPQCNDAPELSTADLETWQDTPGTALVTVEDPDGDADAALFEIVQEPENGSAEIAQDGTITFVPDAGFVGTDVVTIAVTDGGNDRWKRTGDPITVEVDVDVLVQEGRPPGEGALGCGCATPAPRMGWLVAPLALLFVRSRGSAPLVR